MVKMVGEHGRTECRQQAHGSAMRAVGILPDDVERVLQIVIVALQPALATVRPSRVTLTAPADRVLLRAMEELASKLKCQAIHTCLPENYASVPDYCSSVLNCFREEGHAVETLKLCKELHPAPPAVANHPPGHAD